MLAKMKVSLYQINPFQPDIVFQIETSNLILNKNEIICFYLKCNTWLKWVEINPNKYINLHFELVLSCIIFCQLYIIVHYTWILHCSWDLLPAGTLRLTWRRGIFVGNEAKGRISKLVFEENKARQLFRKTNIS